MNDNKDFDLQLINFLAKYRWTPIDVDGSTGFVISLVALKRLFKSEYPEYESKKGRLVIGMRNLGYERSAGRYGKFIIYAK